ncbi:hypothetical protein SUGI_0532480 [Cryptomeria japonica]|nr:hypothetical protein SUGI_0532480 [Cryptomeria japonica]
MGVTVNMTSWEGPHEPAGYVLLSGNGNVVDVEAIEFDLTEYKEIKKKTGCRGGDVKRRRGSKYTDRSRWDLFCRRKAEGTRFLSEWHNLSGCCLCKEE